MSVRSMLAGGLLLLVPALLSAQSPSVVQQDRPSLVVFANGGGGSPLANLDDAGTSDFKTGWTVGGGAGVQLNRYVAVRATFDYLRNKGDESSAAFAGQRFNHYFYGGDVQLRYPLASGFSPYLLAGAGAVTIDNKDDPSFESATKFAGKGGLGIEYVFPTANGLGAYIQGASYIYPFDRGGFDKTQFDVLWTAGLSYRFGL